MAIVKLGPIVSGISGKVGTVVFANAKQALVLRPTPRTRRKSSNFLLRSQGFMSNIRRRWATLTDLQQNAWRTAAAELASTNRLGQSRPRNGFQYFVMTNKVVFPGPKTIIEDPPSPDIGTLPVNPTVEFSASVGLLVTIDNPGSPSFLQMQVYGWPFWVDHDTNAVARLVFLDERSASAEKVVDNVIGEWEQHFGPVQIGQRFAVGLKSRLNANPFLPIFIFRGTVVA